MDGSFFPSNFGGPIVKVVQLCVFPNTFRVKNFSNTMTSVAIHESDGVDTELKYDNQEEAFVQAYPARWVHLRVSHVACMSAQISVEFYTSHSAKHESWPRCWSYK